MPVSEPVARYLRRHDVAFLEIAHPAAFTSSAVAVATHLGERGLARLVAVRDQEASWLLAVIPPHLEVDLEALSRAAGHSPLALVSEVDVVRRLGVSELGDSVPFGELSGLAIYLDEAFQRMSHIYFQDGTHRGVFGMRLRDYLRVAKPIVASFAVPGDVNRDGALARAEPKSRSM